MVGHTGKLVFAGVLKPTGPKTSPKHTTNQPKPSQNLPQTFPKPPCGGLGVVLSGSGGVWEGLGGFWDPVGFNRWGLGFSGCLGRVLGGFGRFGRSHPATLQAGVRDINAHRTLMNLHYSVLATMQSTRCLGFYGGGKIGNLRYWAASRPNPAPGGPGKSPGRGPA